MKKIFNCLNANQNIFGKFFLEASAGTGKTFAIEHLVIRMIIESNISIEEILVVTFTRAAANELKVRIRSNIENILTILKSDELDKIDYLKNIKDVSQTKARLEEALLYFDKAQIFTIHSFCYNILKEFAFDAKVSFSLQEPNSVDLNKIIKNNIIECFYISSDINVFQISILLKKYKDFETVVNRVRQLIDVDHEKRIFFEEGHVRFLQNLKNINDLSIEDFDLICSQFKKTQNQIDFDLWKKIFFTKSCDKNDFIKVIQLAKAFFKFFEIKNLRKKHDDKALKKDLYHFINNLSKWMYKLYDPYEILLSLSYKISIKIEKVKKDEDFFSYDDLLKKVQLSLNNESFRNEVTCKYKTVMIDEFQDTDPIQWNIFETLFLSNSNKLEAFYLIGDPKQSIYGFRNADIYTYFEAKEKFKEDSFYYLNTNYRSTSALVDAYNLLFSKEWMNLPKKKKNLKYNAVSSHDGKNDFDKTILPIHFFIAEDKSSLNARWPTKALEELFFSYIASEINKLQKENNIDLDEIAVLVSDRYQAEKLMRSFSYKNISATYKSHESIAKSKATKYLKEIFLAVINFPDLNYIKIALAGPYIQKKALFIKDVNYDSNIIKKFMMLQKCLRTEKLPIFFNEFLNMAFDEDNKSVLDILASNKNLSFYHETMQLIEIILKLFQEQKPSYDGIIDLFDSLLSKDPEQDENIRKRVFSNEKSVQVMTTHMSKGLEFDVVFCLGMGNRSPKNENIIEKIEENDAEKLRQYYVAITRAKKRVYIPIAVDLNNTTISYGSASAVELFFSSHKWDERYEIIKQFTSETYINELKNYNNYISYDLLKLNESYNENVVVKPVNLSFLSNVKTFLFNSKILSFSHLEKRTEKDLFYVEKETKGLPLGSKTGIMLHSILDKIFKRKSFLKSEYSLFVYDSNKNTEFEVYNDYIITMIENLLEVLLFDGDKSFSFLNVDKRNFHSELEFVYSIDNSNHYMKGIIDLVFEYNNKLYIVDWKSNFLEDGYDKISLQNAMEENDYFLQAAIYSKAISSYLCSFEKKLEFGGVFYLFLRGINKNKSDGIYYFMPEASIVNNKEKMICIN